MALRVRVDQLIRDVGHDGSEIIFPDLQEPMCRRGFHSQELIQVAWKHGFACTPIELFPQIAPTSGDASLRVLFGSEADTYRRFEEYINTTFGVLEGQGRNCHHAVHYRHGSIWDPDGHTYRYSRQACESRGFYGNRLWAFTRRDF